MAAEPSVRYGYIDALRGIAAILVVLHHCILAAGVGFGVFDWMNLGRIGVVTFFLISGYVIPFSFQGSSPRIGFVIARMFRLYPAYWLSILLAVSLLPLATEMQFSQPMILANATMLQVFLGQPDILSTYWTLALELIFYGTCFLAFSFGKLACPNYHAISAAVICIAALLASVIKYTMQHHGIPSGSIFLIAFMHAGALARQALMEGNPQAMQRLKQVLLLLVVMAPAINYISFAAMPGGDWIARVTGCYLGSALFFYAVLRRAFVSGITLFLGAISYSIYLIHPLVLMLLQPWIDELPDTHALIGALLAGLTGSMLVATAMHYWIEKPMILVGKNLIGRLHRV